LDDEQADDERADGDEIFHAIDDIVDQEGGHLLVQGLQGLLAAAEEQRAGDEAGSLAQD